MDSRGRETLNSDIMVNDATSPQFVSQRRQQVAEVLRNKGVICEDYLMTMTCPRSPFCPYMHIRNGELRPLPWSVCAFFNQGVCLRDRCTFFHGSQEQLSALRSQRAKVYRPQDYMQVARPPREFLTPDGNLSTNVTDDQLEAARTAKTKFSPQPHPVTSSTHLMAQSTQTHTPIYVLPPPPQASSTQPLMINTPVQIFPASAYTPVRNYAYMTTSGGLPMIISTADTNLPSPHSTTFGTTSSVPSVNQYPQVTQYNQPPAATYQLYRFQ